MPRQFHGDRVALFLDVCFLALLAAWLMLEADRILYLQIAILTILFAISIHWVFGTSLTLDEGQERLIYRGLIRRRDLAVTDRHWCRVSVRPGLGLAYLVLGDGDGGDFEFWALTFRSKRRAKQTADEVTEFIHQIRARRREAGFETEPGWG